GPASLYVTSINRTTFVNGTVAAGGRHTAQVSVDQFGWQLSCEPIGCADVAQTPAACPPARNKLELVRADDGTTPTCNDLIDNAATLFPNGLPENPPSCP
ncbi:MAG TPA: hypothetical protein VFX59_11115, partial [Polyangiales bacterium]|nr:hypothetical protein [Polyangiales bacterium]